MNVCVDCATHYTKLIMAGQMQAATGYGCLCTTVVLSIAAVGQLKVPYSEKLSQEKTFANSYKILHEICKSFLPRKFPSIQYHVALIVMKQLHMVVL